MPERKVFVVLSPHFDDAVLSVGAWLSRHPGSVVATVCSGLPGEGVPAHSWDAVSGYSSGNDATFGRRAEDKRALASLDAQQRILGFLDGPYRDTTGKDHETKPASVVMVEALTDAVVALIEELQPDRFLFPLGWGHGDHLVTSDSAIAAIVRTKVPALAYAELPYAIARPEFLGVRIAHIEGLGLQVRPYPTPIGDFDLKRTAWDCYPSQQVHLDVTGCFDADAEQLYRIVAGN